MRSEDNGYYMRLSNGRRFYCFNGCLSIDPLSDSNDIYYGYDGGTWPEGEPEEQYFTAEEKREIAEAMVKRWREWGGL